MRRFACRNLQISTKLYGKLSYTPCYTQYGLFKVGCWYEEQIKNFLKMCGGKFNSEYLYIKLKL